MLGGALRTLGFRGGGNMERGGAIRGGPARGGGGGIPVEKRKQKRYGKKNTEQFNLNHCMLILRIQVDFCSKITFIDTRAS